MTLVGVSRIVPSGKVYRQIFDDEVNLVRTLGETRSKIAQQKVPPNAGRIPLVRDLETCTGNGFLSHRQTMWVESMPNDDFTENPVLYKESTALALEKAKESNTVIAAREVRGLAEVIIHEKRNRNIIERISESRKGRHDEAVAALRQELAHAGKEMEQCILEPGISFLSKLAESDKTIERIFLRAEKDSDLITYTTQDFDEMWNLICQQSLLRRQWIRELDEALRKAEVDRTERIKALLKRCTKILEDIAYFLSPDVHRLIHNEAMMINQALLANRRAIARLFMNLMEADLKQEVFQWYQLEERINIWRAVQKDHIICSFREFMDSERIQDPSAVNTELENMLKEQRSLSEKRAELLNYLGNVLPLSHTKAKINEWYESVVALNKRIDTHNVQCMMRIRLQYEKVCQECLAKVQDCKQKLLEMKICTEKEAEKVVNPHFFQLVGRLQSRFEHEVETMDKDFEHLVKHTEINCSHLYQYFQDAQVLLDTHQQNLIHQENDLYSKLNECRNKHEGLNKLRESHLDMSMDKLRIQSTDEKLKLQLEKVYAALDFIRAGYELFHQDLMARVVAYPDHVLQELISYSTSLSRYFRVKQIYKGKPIRKEPTPEEEEMAESYEESEDMEETLEDSLEHAAEEVLEEEHIPEEAMKEDAADVEELQQAEKAGDTEGSAQGSDVLGVLGDGTSLVLGSDDPDGSLEGSSIVQEAGDVQGREDILGSETVRLPDTPSEPTEEATEFFTTSGGSTYKVLENSSKLKIKKSEKYYAGKLNENFLPPYLEQVYLSQSFFADLRRRIRLQFFEHLENWFPQSVSKSWLILAARKEELNAELQLRLHLHEPRREHIEKDIYHVRIAELRLHSDRLTRHCAGMLQALNSERASFFTLRDDQNAISKNFRLRIQDMENVFLTESRAEKLLSLSNNLHTELINHVEIMQVSLRSFRQYLEEALGKLRDANTDFLKACRLFSEGGNFSTEEIEHFIKRLDKENGRIDFVEGLIMIDMEKLESSYLDQATEVINKFENRFRYLALDRLFMDKIQQFLTSIQVKIKTEVAKSNLQTQMLNSHLDKLVSRIDACTHPNVDKEPITSEELYECATFVMEEMKKRSLYLNCLLGPDTIFSLADKIDPATQSSAATSMLTDSLLQEYRTVVMGIESTPLLNASKMGKPAFDDPAISVIKQLIGLHRSRKALDQLSEKQEGAGGGAEGPCPAPPIPTISIGSPYSDRVQGHGGHTPTTVKKSSSKGTDGSTVSVKYTKATRADKKTQIFGERLKDSDSGNFRATIFNMVWDNFDVMLNIAEDFYKKDKHQITRPEFLQETYDQCVEVIGQKLLLYLGQTDEYHTACISEFWNQLKRFEGLLPEVTKLTIAKRLRDFEQLFASSMGQIRRNFQEQLQKWDAAKEENKNKLLPSLGHPDNLPQLEALCQEEEERQRDQVEGIYYCTQKLQNCAVECAQKFISALASRTEKILMELDNCLTADDVQLRKIETPREKTSTLIRRKRAGLSLELEESKLMAERGSRTWPGIPRTTLQGFLNQIICRETASMTTSKTTLGHLAAVRERDAVYVKFKQTLEVEFARIKEENKVHLMKAEHWADWWTKSVQKIKELYM
ncbi:coiled-coil domain-containing protein 180 [Hemicordylus capensis]|uniref:coiled-coil domain-containing protein 180 n=1 Tax=Hemicordylus capensis TaxID=884348 RepID=UPI002304B7B5|nr:coiled-coil domain-containing protein 180 [Hemicordylus capensis]